MAALIREGASQFRVRLLALDSGEREVDPYLVGRAIAEVMRACTSRSATGRPLLWNDYRVVLSRADFEALGPLGASLEGDLEAAAELEAEGRDAELVGAIRVSVVLDESDELGAGDAVVRVAFVAPERPDDERGLVTLREDALHVAKPSRAVAARAPASAREVRLAWPGGETLLAPGTTVILGRPHPAAPSNFVALEGASAKINKLQLALTLSPSTVRVRRLPSANPVEVLGTSVPAGGELEVDLPAKISLSKGDLVLRLSRA